MRRTLALLLFLALTVVAVSVEGQVSPDLQGVRNFDSGVPMQRPAALGDKKFFTKEEAEKHRATTRNALFAIAKIAPIEAVGLDWFDGTPRVENLRTSLISYPDNGRLPPLVQGVRRTPGVEDFITLLGDRKGDLPPNFAAFAAAFAGGSKASYTDFVPAARCRHQEFRWPFAKLRRRGHLTRQGGHRALHPNGTGPARVQRRCCRPEDISGPSRDNLPYGPRRCPDPRIRVSRRQLQHAELPRGSAPGRRQEGKIINACLATQLHPPAGP